MLLLLAIIVATAAATQSHPTLPNLWRSETNEPGMGPGIEAYKFVDVPTSSNPSALWSNYSGCQRLIWIENDAQEARFLLGCDALACCTEQQDGNQVEFQIPNTPNAKVSYMGKKNITTSFQKTVLADLWHWKVFEIVSYWVYTTPAPGAVNNITLWRYQTDVGPEPYIIDFNTYIGYNANTISGQKFLQQFQVPAVCQGNVPRCGDARKAGLLKTEWKEPTAYRLMRGLQRGLAAIGKRSASL
jgi:hypothetical protein